MKIAILTFNTALNYGALLQSYALQQKLIQMGHDVKHIKVRATTPKSNLKKMIKTKLERKKLKSYESFMNKYLSYSLEEYDENSIYNIVEEFDAFVSGSDQVWNTKNGVDPIFFQVFVPDHKLKISYAASLGIKTIPALFVDEVARAINRFDSISVREEEAVTELEKYTSLQIENHLDPVFSLNASEWGKLAGERILSKPYVFVYGTQMTDALKNIARKLAKEHNLELVSIFPMRGAKSVDWKTGPLEFVNLIKYADYVVTSSFHATAFSLIFKKKIIEVLHSATGARARNLLQTFGCESCIYDEVTEFTPKWNYDKVDSIIKAENLRTDEYLAQALISKINHVQPLYKEISLDHISFEHVVEDPKIRCTGCNLCLSICPKSAIKVVKHKDGFSYPRIDQTSCIRCGLCHRLCPSISNHETSKKTIKESFAIKSKSSEVLLNSSSGGVFVHLSDKVIERGGIVYGCKFDKNFAAVLDRAETKEKRNTFCGSKYVQSNAGTIYQSVSHDLKNGKPVLFSGLPCQVQALKVYLEWKNVSTEQLYTIDLICHGSANPTIWHDHLDLIKSKKNNDNIKGITFRKKDDLGNGQCLNVEFEHEAPYFARSGHDVYYRLFLKNYLLRPSCFSCKYSTLTRVGDITLGDWGAGKRLKPDFMPYGASQVFVNSNKGKELLHSVIDQVDILPIELKNCLQPNLMHPSRKPKKYDEFFEKYENSGFHSAAWHIMNPKERLQFVFQNLGLNEAVFRLKK